MKILLAGATGVIGRSVAPLLVAAGHSVVGTSRQRERFEAIANLGAQPVHMDALDRDETRAVMAAVRPDLLMHQLTDLSDRNFAGNATLRRLGTRNLVDAALENGVQHMIAQSISWIHVAGSAPAKEDEPLDLSAAEPRRTTVASVQALEQAVAEMPHAVVLRYGTLYGNGTWYCRDGLVSRQLRDRALTASMDMTSFVQLDDAAHATVQALAWPTGTYAIVDDQPVAAKDWMPFYASHIGAPAPTPSDQRQGWARGNSNAKARSLGWSPAAGDWRKGLSDLLS